MNKIILDDCISYMKKLKELSVDHVITDIPYNVVSRDSNGIRDFDKKEADLLEFNLNEFIDGVTKITKSKVFIFCSSEQVSVLVELLESKNFESDLAIWQKTNPSPVNGQYIWLSGVECCVVASRGKLSEDLKDVIWTTPNGRSKNHPTEKPLKLMELIIRDHTEIGDYIYDPCSGSGSTLEAAENLNRNWLGTERFEDYYNYIVERMKKKL